MKTSGNGRFGRRGDRPAAEVPQSGRDHAPPAERRGGDRRVTPVPVAVERRSGRDRRLDLEARRASADDGSLFMIAPAKPAGDGGTYISSTRYALPPHLVPLSEQVRTKILDSVDLNDHKGLPEGALRAEIVDVIYGTLAVLNIPLSIVDQRTLVESLVNDLMGYGPLEPLLADASVTDIMVNGPDSVWIERQGQLEKTDVRFNSVTHLVNVITRIVSHTSRHVNESSPMVDARLPDGSRVNAVLPPLAVPTPSLSIRKFPKKRMSLADLAEKGACSPDMALLLRMIAKYRLNVLVSGGTGTGKTTMLKAMADEFDPRQRVITIEDTAELALKAPNMVAMEARPPNSEGAGTVTIQQLLRNALRMRPDRIIIGEVRGPEAGDLLEAMNTGHDGSMGTIHANSARDALSRFFNMVCLNERFEPNVITRQQIASALHVVIQLTRMRDGSRRISTISEIAGIEGDVILMQDLFNFVRVEERTDGTIIGSFASSRVRPRFLDRLKFLALDDDEKELIQRLADGNGRPASAPEDAMA